MERGTHTFDEITTQPDAWAQASEIVELEHDNLSRLLHDQYDQVLFTGCGSTYYLSLSAAALFQQLTGRFARAVPGGELVLNPDITLGRDQSRKTLLVAVSRSGATTETIRAVDQFRQQQRGPVIVITNYGDQPLAALADVALVIDKGQEHSIAQTRSFASMYVAGTALAALAAADRHLLDAIKLLPQAGWNLLAAYEPLARQLGENLAFDRFYFLGSGIRYGLACEVNLKMKEMTLTHSEPFHFLEFRHGPMSMASSTAVVIGLLSDKNYRHESAVLNEMSARGAEIVSLAETNAWVAFNSGLPESIRGVLYLPVLQLMAFYRSMAKGLDPDRPNNLTAVIKLDL